MESINRITIMSVLLALVSACGGGGGGGGSAGLDPLVESFPIAYVKRPFPLRDPNNNDQIIQPDARDPLQFNPGSELYIRDHASAQAKERRITGAVTEGAGDVKDVSVSYDGKKLLFALKKPDIAGRQPEEQPTWNIWEYNIETDTLRRIIKLDIFAEEGDDVAPAYLPDGRIVFSSTRQYGSKETLANEGKPRYTSLVDQENRPAMMLHVMNDDGTDIQQITFGLDIAMDPYVRSDGRIVFAQWDRYLNRDGINIYAVNPDGTHLELLYGAHSHNSGPDAVQFTQLREYPDGRVLSLLRPYTDTFGGGDIGLIDTDYFADVKRPTKDNIGIPGTGQESLTGGEASATSIPSMGGRYISVFPLWDGSGRSLVSWSPCRVIANDVAVPCTAQRLAKPNVIEADPVYSLYIYDPAQDTKLPIFLPKAGKAITDVVAAQPRSYPRVLDDTVTDSTQKTGILHIRSVYDMDGTFDPRGSTVLIPETRPIPDPAPPGFKFTTDVPQSIAQLVKDGRPSTRTARFLRLIKPFVRPDPNDFRIPRLAFGRNQSRDGLMEIIGYAPIEPDGSVKVRVPADTPFSFQIVDRNARRIGAQRHMYWLTVRKGETLECNGCHNHDSGIPHGRQDAVAAQNTGAKQDGPFPGQVDTLAAQRGETMAETRTRIDCDTDSTCPGLNPSVDIVYRDIWTKEINDTNGAPVVAKGQDLDYLYNDIFDFADAITDPVSQSCVNKWTEKCRMVINYVTHIDPLWSKTRLIPDPNNAGAMLDRTCSQNGCHSPVGIDTKPQIPEPAMGSQLNLNNVSLFDPDDDPDRLEAYTELLVTDNEQILDAGGSLADRMVDDLNNPIFDTDGVTIIGYQQKTVSTTPGRPMIPGAARASRFFNVFSDSANAIHYDTVGGQGILSPSELKLISEWLDIGGQYYNDPFAVP